MLKAIKNYWTELCTTCTPIQPALALQQVHSDHSDLSLLKFEYHVLIKGDNATYLALSEGKSMGMHRIIIYCKLGCLLQLWLIPLDLCLMSAISFKGFTLWFTALSIPGWIHIKGRKTWWVKYELHILCLWVRKVCHQSASRVCQDFLKYCNYSWWLQKRKKMLSLLKWRLKIFADG